MNNIRGLICRPLFLVPFFAFVEFCNAQETYPPIVTDSVALINKSIFLNSIKELQINTSEGPNIIVILADDLGKNDISLYDSLGVPTPNINRLANEGIVCTYAYATSAICFPSRAGLVTGRYQHRFGNERMMMQRYPRNKLERFVFQHFINTYPMHLIDPWYSPPAEEIQKQGLPESEISIFEIMHHAGISTACIGKWHLGYNNPFLPSDKAVDHFYGFYEAFSLYAPKRDKNIVNYKHKIFQNKHIWRQKRKGPCAIVRNNEVIVENDYLTTRIAEETCEFIRNHPDSTFFLYVPFSAPHTPFQAPKSYYDKFSHITYKNKRVYYAMIAALDDAVGAILNQLQESGLEDNTLVFFTSDNGGATYTHATTNGELKGGKITNFEGGLNVPFIVKWKDNLPAGSWYREPVSLLDIFATSCAVLNIPLADHSSLDGKNLIPYMSDTTCSSPHEYLFWRTDYNKVVRHGDWKLIVNTRDQLKMLYNLDEDEGENQNLSNEYPGIVKQLEEKLDEWEEELMQPLWPGVMEYEEIIDGIKMRYAL